MRLWRSKLISAHKKCILSFVLTVTNEFWVTESKYFIRSAAQSINNVFANVNKVENGLINTYNFMKIQLEI